MKSPRNMRNSAGGGFTEATEVAVNLGVRSWAKSLVDALDEVRSTFALSICLAVEGQR